MADPIFDLNMNKYGINLSELNLTKDDFNENTRSAIAKRKILEHEEDGAIYQGD